MAKVQMGKLQKVVEVVTASEANDLEAGGEYYVDRFSESRGVYILMRRERTRQ